MEAAPIFVHPDCYSQNENTKMIKITTMNKPG